MTFGKTADRAVVFTLAALTMGGLVAAPIAAHADDPGKGKDGKKGGQVPIVIGPSTIVKDPPSNPPKKKDK